MLVVMTVIALIAGIYIPKYRVARGDAAYQGCLQNLTNIGVALQTYANDNSQYYPPTLSTLVPADISAMPTCPNAGGVDTYSPSYQFAGPAGLFTIYCSGNNHADTVNGVPNAPYYIMGQGAGP